MPNNEVSVREWSKHIATSQRNYLDENVIFEVECSDQNIYAALQDQFEKIQKVLNYCQKIIRAIPYYPSKHYSFNYTLIKVKYKFTGFHPKGIKFSFDVQNVVTAFIGEDLYKDRMTALREAVQNAIDSCRYKRTFLKEDYSPVLKITLNENSIKIEDNGAGMDEFIIENFFGRLASSFYEQEKIKTQFEAIGQFGVGVFSYFLLSEYIDIETKTDKSDTLKFRFDKDPKSYFHFYDQTERVNAGTTITMYIKEEFQNLITFQNIESYIRKIFKHIEFPLEIADQNNKLIVETSEFSIDSKFEIQERLKLQNKQVEDDLELIVEAISDDDMEGVCGLIVAKNPLETFKFSSDYFDNDQFITIGRRHPLSQIAISQKGVFVNYYNASSLGLLIGDLNLKKKVKINLDRNEFTDNYQIHPLIQRFEYQILRRIFKDVSLSVKSDEQRLTLSENFVSNYFQVIPYLPSLEYRDEILNFLHIKTGEGSIYNLARLPEVFPDFILISTEENLPLNTESSNVVLSNDTNYIGAFSEMTAIFKRLLSYNEYIFQEGNKFYKGFTQKPFESKFISDVNKIQDLNNKRYIKLSPINSEKIIVNIWKNKDRTINYYGDDFVYFNYNHHFIQYILANQVVLSSNPESRKIIRSVFDYILEFLHQDVNKISINKLNTIIKPLNQIGRINNFTKKDF